MVLYHLVQRNIWEACKSSGKPYLPPTYSQDGFIHLTEDPKYLLGIGNHFYRDVPGDFLLLVLDRTTLTSKVVFEAAAPVGSRGPPDGVLLAGGMPAADQQAPPPLFPHLYGSIDYGAVERELLVKRDSEGHFLSIAGLEGMHTDI